MKRQSRRYEDSNVELRDLVDETENIIDLNDVYDDSVQRLSRDLRNAAATLGDQEVRYLVRDYYTMQTNRMAYAAQKRELGKTEQPSLLVSWLGEQSSFLERQIKASLDIYTINHEMGSWLRKIYGIGPVLAAAMLSEIDITRCPTVGHIWSYAGIWGSTQPKKEKGKPIPWNPDLKVFCWKIGQSFMKQSFRPECYYGKIYKERKAWEVNNNQKKAYAEQAAECLPHFKKTTEAYKYYEQGMLPPAHIDARARRYAVKIFLSHMQEEWFRRHFQKEPPLPYMIAIKNHSHYIPPPPGL